MSFGDMSISPPSANSDSISSDEDFEQGDNQVEMQDEMDFEDESKFQHIVNNHDSISGGV